MTAEDRMELSQRAAACTKAMARGLGTGRWHQDSVSFTSPLMVWVRGQMVCARMAKSSRQLRLT